MTTPDIISQVLNINQRKPHPPTFFMQTFGCQMNVRESEKLQGFLTEMGFAPAKSESDASLIMYNTCSVRENPENKVFGRLGHLKKQRQTGTEQIIVLCGCMPQQDSVLDALRAKKLPVDIIFGTFNKHHFPRLLLEFLQTGTPVLEVLNDYAQDSGIAEEAYNAQTARYLPHKAGITIMHGCNNFCSYCIVPYVRGREKSRPPESILAEVSALAADGVKEIMLLGQNVNSYDGGGTNFAELLKAVNAVEGIKRIRFMTSHPKDLSDELIDVLAAPNKICKAIHLPMQAGSTAVLSRMNRGYTKDGYLALIARLRDKVPQIAITTDIIVAFPGETEADFEDTLDVVRQADFAGAFTFIYSPRTGTPAASFTDLVPKEAADERFKRLAETVNPLQLAHNRALIGQAVEVMVDEIEEKGEKYTGRTDANVLVHFKAGDSSRLFQRRRLNRSPSRLRLRGRATSEQCQLQKLPFRDITPGEIVRVKIDDCKTFYAMGKKI